MYKETELFPRWLRWMALALVLVQLGLTALYTAAYLGSDGGIPTLVDVEIEGNLPTWWSTVLITVAALLAGAIALLRRRAGDSSWFWMLFAAGMFALSLEEGVSLHERVGVRVNAAEGRNAADWTLVYIPFLAAGAFVAIKAVLTLPRPLAAMSLAGLALYVAAVVAEVSAIATGFERGVVLFEENAEILGHSLILLALASYLAARLRPLLAPARDPRAETSEATSPDEVLLHS